MAKKASKKPSRKKSSAKKKSIKKTSSRKTTRTKSRKATKSTRRVAAKRAPTALKRRSPAKKLRPATVPYHADPDHCTIVPKFQNFLPGDEVQFTTTATCTLVFAQPSPIGTDRLQLEPGPPNRQTIDPDVEWGTYPFWIETCDDGREVCLGRSKRRLMMVEDSSGPSDIIVP